MASSEINSHLYKIKFFSYDFYEISEWQGLAKDVLHTGLPLPPGYDMWIALNCCHHLEIGMISVIFHVISVIIIMIISRMIIIGDIIIRI